MIVFNIIIWSIVSTVWAALAWWKSTITGTKIWPDVANNLFLKKYQDDHNLMNLFTKGDKE